MKKYFIWFLVALVVTGACKKKAKTTQDDDRQETTDKNRNADAALMGITTPDLGVEGQAIPVRGKIQNFKSDTIRSLEIKWQADNGEEYAAVFDGLEIPSMGVFEFEHPTPYVPVRGRHTLSVWISDVNGNGPDSRPENDRRSKELLIGSNSVEHKVLYEEFTSSTCSPCYVFNTQYFNESFLNQIEGKYNLIKYQMNWPGAGDPYYTPEGGTRRIYYGVTGVPTLFIDGDEGTFFDRIALRNDFNKHYAVPGLIDLQAFFDVDSVTKQVRVEVHGTPYISGHFRMHIAVVEKETRQNATTNGETRFFNVMMKMVPDASGIDVNLTDGESFVETQEASLEGTHIEEYGDLAVIVFIQDHDTRRVFQSVSAEYNPALIP